MQTALHAIFQTDCRTLDIGERTGRTSYIDFIKPDELANASLMKGEDMYGRRFLVFKSEVRVDGERIRLFTTFFQRYPSESESNDEVLYHTAGHYGTHMFTTTGGSSLVQMEYVRDFVRDRRIDLTVDQMKLFRIGYRDTFDLEQVDPNTVDTITLGWSEE